MTKPFEFHGVEAEKAEAMRRYNNRRSFRNILRSAAVASLCCYLWFPTTVAISLGDWFHLTGAVIVTNRSVVFAFANLLVALIFLLSRERDDETSTSVSTEQDLYDQYTSSSGVIVTASDDDSNDDRRTIVCTEPVQHASDEKVEDDDSNKQIVPAFMAEADREADCKGIYRRTKSETKKEIIRTVTEFRRTESAIERLSSEEFRLKVEKFIMEKKMTLVHGSC